MTLLTSSSTFTVGEASTESLSISLIILPAVGSSTGKGRLIHPTLGTYDYPHAPDSWSNMDGDAIIAPIWASTKTLDGAANTLFPGNLRDGIFEERWNDQLSMSREMMRMLASFWQNPPDPSVGFVEWFPNYTNAHGYKVILLALEVGGQGINLDYVSRQGWITGQVVLRMKITGRV